MKSLSILRRMSSLENKKPRTSQQNVYKLKIIHTDGIVITNNSMWSFIGGEVGKIGNLRGTYLLKYCTKAYSCLWQ